MLVVNDRFSLHFALGIYSEDNSNLNKSRLHEVIDAGTQICSVIKTKKIKK